MIQEPPKNFYIWAWADIRITLVCISSGGAITEMFQKNNALIGCSNWFLPVSFLIERIKD